MSPDGKSQSSFHTNQMTIAKDLVHDPAITETYLLAGGAGFGLRSVRSLGSFLMKLERSSMETPPMNKGKANCSILAV
jgi:hypothetical protein